MEPIRVYRAAAADAAAGHHPGRWYHAPLRRGRYLAAPASPGYETADEARAAAAAARCPDKCGCRKCLNRLGIIPNMMSLFERTD